MGTPINIETKTKVDHYNYQQALDLYAAIKPELNVTDEQYKMHTDKIKEQGKTTKEVVSIVTIPWDDADLPADCTGTEYADYNVFEKFVAFNFNEVPDYDGKSLKFLLPKGFTLYGNTIYYNSNPSAIYGGPSCVNGDLVKTDIYGFTLFTGTTTSNVVASYGSKQMTALIINDAAKADGRAWTDEEFEFFKTNLRFYIAE